MFGSLVYTPVRCDHFKFSVQSCYYDRTQIGQHVITSAETELRADWTEKNTSDTKCVPVKQSPSSQSEGSIPQQAE